MSIIPATRNLTLYQGSTFDVTLTFYTDAARTTLKDLTGYTAALQARKTYAATEKLLDLTNGTLSATPAEDVLVMGGAAGTIRIYVRDETMAALNADDFTATAEADGSTTYSGVWDLELTNALGETSRYVRGAVTLEPEVTR